MLFGLADGGVKIRNSEMLRHLFKKKCVFFHLLLSSPRPDGYISILYYVHSVVCPNNGTLRSNAQEKHACRRVGLAGDLLKSRHLKDDPICIAFWSGIFFVH